MRSYLLWIALAVLGFAAAVAAHFHFAVVAQGYEPGGPYFTPWVAFIGADWVVKQGIIGLVMMSFAAMVVAWLGARELRRGKPRTEAEIVLRFAAAIAPAYGLSLALYSEGMIRMASAATSVTKPWILAPGRAEAMLPVAAGMFTAIVALIAARHLFRRSEIHWRLTAERRA